MPREALELNFTRNYWAMGWADNERHKDAYDWPGLRYHRAERTGGKVVAEYIYDDEKGNPYLRVERTEDKQFLQSHWVRNGLSGRWQYGAPKGPKIPTSFPILLSKRPMFRSSFAKARKTPRPLWISNWRRRARLAARENGRLT